MHDFNGNFFGMHFFWWIFWIAIAIIAFYIISNLINNNSTKSTAIEILKKRFANGEITKEEFEESKKVLNK